jgi:ribonuclease J
VKLQKRFEHGNLTVEVYGGFGEVGGNCIVIRDGDRKLVFDYGIRYNVMRRYYGGRIEPLGPAEMIKLGVVPSPEVTEGTQALYISHLHLDHVGLLSTAYSSTPIVFPDRDIARATIGAWYEKSPRWLAYIPPRNWDLTSSARVLGEDKDSVIAIPVSHSAYPATAYIYMGRGATLFYSGDFRLHALVQFFPSLEESLQKLGVNSIDVAIIEGTNIGNPAPPMARSGFEEIMISSVKTFDGVIVSVDPHDFEAMMFIYRVVEKSQRDVVIASERIYWMLRVIYEKMPKHINKTLTALETSKQPPPIPLSSVSLVNEVFKDMKRYIVVAEPVHLLEHLRRLKVQGREIDLANTVALLLDPEPRETVREVENKVLIQWLEMFGAQPQRVRLSGHYQPQQLKQIIQILKPKQLIPIHTEEPELMLRLFEKYRRLT